MWDAQSGVEIACLRGHSRLVGSVSFGPDGQRVATASHDNTARLWDAESGFEIACLKGHVNHVYEASFSPDGRRIVTASEDGTARVLGCAKRRRNRLPAGPRSQSV